MPRETKLQRLEREHRDAVDELDSQKRYVERLVAERDRLEDRCTFLFMQAEDFAAALTQMRLGNMSPAPGTRLPERSFGGRLRAPESMQYLEVKERLR